MRRFLCLLLCAALLIPCAAAAETEWAKISLPKNRLPEQIEIVPWDELEPNAMGQHHYLLLCIDQKKSKPRPEGIDPPTYPSGSRRNLYGDTDGMVILTLDTAMHRIMITSIIRDATIVKPSSTETRQDYGRINYVYNDYGPDALCRVISQHLGIKIEKYILFNFSQVEDIIDLPILDGVYLYLTDDEISYLARYAVPKHSVIKADGYFTAYGDPLQLHYVTKDRQPLDFSIPASVFTVSEDGIVSEPVSFQGPSGSSISFGKKAACSITLPDGSVEEGFYEFTNNRLAVMTGEDVHLNALAPAGIYHLKGHSALLYMRIRKSSLGDTDFMRTQRVRNVLSALADQCRSFSLDEANDLANSIMQHNDTTNMSLKEMTDAATTAWGLRDCTIEEFRVPQEEDVRPINFGSMAAEEINWSSTREKFRRFLDHTVLIRDIDYVVSDDN